MNKEAPCLPQLPTEQDWTPSRDSVGCHALLQGRMRLGHAAKIVGDLSERV